MWSSVCGDFSDVARVHGHSPFELMIGRRPRTDFPNFGEGPPHEPLPLDSHADHEHAKKLEHQRLAWQAVVDSMCASEIEGLTWRGPGRKHSGVQESWSTTGELPEEEDTEPEESFVVPQRF